MESTISILNDMNEMEKVETFLEKFTEEASIEKEIKLQLSLILDELVTNIISYGYKDNKEHRIDLLFSRKYENLMIRIEDEGIEFNPLEAPPPDINIPLEERPIGGLGIHIVKNIVNNIEYKRENSKNILIMDIKL